MISTLHYQANIRFLSIIIMYVPYSPTLFSKIPRNIQWQNCRVSASIWLSASINPSTLSTLNQHLSQISSAIWSSGFKMLQHAFYSYINNVAEWKELILELTENKSTITETLDLLNRSKVWLIHYLLKSAILLRSCSACLCLSFIENILVIILVISICIFHLRYYLDINTTCFNHGS